MMSKFKSLQLAVDLAAANRDQALADLKKQRQAHAFAQDQMNQLQQYAVETEQRWTRSAQNSTTPELMHHHYQFMGRLQQAVTLQQGVLDGSSRKVDAAQQRVLQAEFRLASLKQVLAKRQADLAKVQQRADQRQMDEFASIQTLRQVRQKMENSYEH